VIEIFDADLGAGANDTSGFRDLNRGGGFNSSVSYQVFRPNGTAVHDEFHYEEQRGSGGS
jgi:hypothetical protein